MAATFSHNKTVNYQKSIIDALRTLDSSLIFKESNTFYWSPSEQIVHYKRTTTKVGIWALLHETGHALLGHRTYPNDFALLIMERDAWLRAKKLAVELQAVSHESRVMTHENEDSRKQKEIPELRTQNSELLKIDDDHIQDCLDSYRDWLHKRSLCPQCNLAGIQTTSNAYTCIFCSATWHVSNERFCRPYRRQINEIGAATS